MSVTRRFSLPGNRLRWSVAILANPSIRPTLAVHGRRAWPRASPQCPSPQRRHWPPYRPDLALCAPPIPPPTQPLQPRGDLSPALIHCPLIASACDSPGRQDIARTSLRFDLPITFLEKRVLSARGSCLFSGLDPTREPHEGQNPFQEPPHLPVSRKHIKNLVATWPLSFSGEAKPLGETPCKAVEGMPGCEETAQTAGICPHRARERTDSNT